MTWQAVWVGEGGAEPLVQQIISVLTGNTRYSSSGHLFAVLLVRPVQPRESGPAPPPSKPVTPTQVPGSSLVQHRSWSVLSSNTLPVVARKQKLEK